MAGEGGAIKMGSESNPVVLDQYQTIVEVGWPSFDYAVIGFGAGFVWNGSGEPPEPPDWANQVCTPHSRTGTRALAEGSLFTNWLTRLEQHISFGTSARLRRKRRSRNTDGDVETHIEWVEFKDIANAPTAEAFGFPIIISYGYFFYAGNENHDVTNAGPAFEMFVRDIDGFPVFDKDSEIVYVEGAEPGAGSTDSDSDQEPIPFVHESRIHMYMWGWPYTEPPECTRFTEGTFVTTLQAATLGPQVEFSPETVNVGALRIIVKKMKFRQVGMAVDWDENIHILFERVTSDEPQEESTDTA